MQGWVSIHRQLNENWIWNDKPFSKGQAWIDILLRVNHKTAKVPIGNQIIDVDKGQTIWSIKDMALKWGWSRKKVDSFLKMLKADGMLHNERTSKYTLLTVVEWDLYQNPEQQKNINSTSTAHQPHTNNNDNNEFNVLNITPELILKHHGEGLKINKVIDINKHFETCWKLYPIKRGKDKITKTHKIELFKYSVKQIQVAINNLIKEYPNKQYQMQGRRFFKGEFKDYLEGTYIATNNAPNLPDNSNNKFHGFKQSKHTNDEIKEKLARKKG